MVLYEDIHTTPSPKDATAYLKRVKPGRNISSLSSSAPSYRRAASMPSPAVLVYVLVGADSSTSAREREGECVSIYMKLYTHTYIYIHTQQRLPVGPRALAAAAGLHAEEVVEERGDEVVVQEGGAVPHLFVVFCVLCLYFGGGGACVGKRDTKRQR